MKKGGIQRNRQTKGRFPLLVPAAVLGLAALLSLCFPEEAANVRETCARFLTGGAELEASVAALGDSLTDGGLPEAAEVWYELFLSGDTENAGEETAPTDKNADFSGT